ncbi:hypothetical protein [Pseudomonas sp. FP1740]|nr:hypothetical protein [Pseudomonas sp. FP1740]WLG43241.1 hypothetical protein PSH69_20580 [Pseudomonas sp. FP1740]
MMQELSNDDMKAGIKAVLEARADRARIDRMIGLTLLLAAALAFCVTL